MTKQQRYLGFLAHVTCDTLQILLILCSDFKGLIQHFLVSKRWESWIQSIRNLICLKLSHGQLCNFNMGEKSLLTIYLRGLYGLQKVSFRVNYTTSYIRALQLTYRGSPLHTDLREIWNQCEVKSVWTEIWILWVPQNPLMGSKYF